ncbi:hypothetical protein Tco_0502781 [Tanacetum coccineum]
MHTTMVPVQVKTMKIQAGVQVSRPGELRRHLQLWKRFGRRTNISLSLHYRNKKNKMRKIWKKFREKLERERAVEYPVLRFRIELDVSDKTASTMVVMFDEPATNLVKCSADSLAAADEDVEVVEEDARSSNVNTSLDINIKQSKKLATKPTVATPSNPIEERGKRVELEDSKEEDTCGMDDGQADGQDSSVSDKSKKKRYIVDDSTSE